MTKPETHTPQDGFLGLTGLAPDTAPLVSVIPYGLEASVSYGGGTARGPQAMISASHQVELFDEELWTNPAAQLRIETLKEPAIPSDIPAALDHLAKLTEDALARGAFPLTLGGEHAITPGALRPFLKRYPGLILLHFDAHADLRDGYEGEHFSHAAAIRRCLDHDPLDVISIGIRNISEEEVPFLNANRHRIHIHWAHKKDDWNIEEMLAPLKGRPFYLTFDLDGFDASVMPATGTPEPGGLFWHDAIRLIRRAAELGEMVGADINELAPKENLHACDFLAAKLAYKILGYKFCRTGQEAKAHSGNL